MNRTPRSPMRSRPAPRRAARLPGWPLSLLLAAAFGAQVALGADAQRLPLPAPQTDGGRPLMQVLKDRRSTREFKPEALAEQHLANLLWAAFGVNREDGHRTAPSTMNLRSIDVYVATADGLFLYDAPKHELVRLGSADLRPLTGGQDYVKIAPVSFIFVADDARLAKAPPADREFYAAADTGYISQNAYLYCASAGLATVVHTFGNRAALAQAMGLRAEQRPVLAQAFGWPK